MSKLKGLLIIFSMLSIQVMAQDKKTLSLNEAIDLGIQNSKQLKINQAKIEEASAAAKEAMERKLPDATASASYLRLGNADVDLKTKNSNSGGANNEPPKVSQVLYGLVNIS